MLFSYCFTFPPKKLNEANRIFFGWRCGVRLRTKMRAHTKRHALRSYAGLTHTRKKQVFYFGIRRIYSCLWGAYSLWERRMQTDTLCGVVVGLNVTRKYIANTTKNAKLEINQNKRRRWKSDLDTPSECSEIIRDFLCLWATLCCGSWAHGAFVAISRCNTIVGVLYIMCFTSHGHCVCAFDMQSARWCERY